MVEILDCKTVAILCVSTLNSTKRVQNRFVAGIVTLGLFSLRFPLVFPRKMQSLGSVHSSFWFTQYSASPETALQVKFNLGSARDVI